MGFNNYFERKIFLEKWEATKQAMLAFGMEQEKILAMREFDWECHKSRRCFEEKWVYNYDPDVTATIDEAMDLGLAIYEQLEDVRLIKGLQALTEKELDVLVKIVIHEYKQVEIAREQGIKESTMSVKYDAIKEKVRRSVEKNYFFSVG